MIKINLSSAPKPKRGKGSSRTTSTQMVDMGGGGGGGGSPILLIAVALVLALGFAGYRYNAAQSTATRIANDTKQAETENRRLAAVKAKYDQEQKVKDNYERRVNVIDTLRAAQSGGSPVNLLTMISDTVNSTDAVWLNSMQDAGGQIRIDGTALSATAVANLIKNLQKTGYFRNVEMSETMEDPQAKDLQAFNFKLVCEKQKS